jgi:hypothetical protein
MVRVVVFSYTWDVHDSVSRTLLTIFKSVADDVLHVLHGISLV